MISEYSEMITESLNNLGDPLNLVPELEVFAQAVALVLGERIALDARKARTVISHKSDPVDPWHQHVKARYFLPSRVHCRAEPRSG